MYKFVLFTIFLTFIRHLITNNVITQIPINLFYEFSITFYITSVFYYIIRFLLNKFSISFQNIQPEHKKMYVVKNYVKSFFLASLCLQLHHFMNLLNGTVDLLFIKKCGAYYIMNDLIGLILVKKLPTTTKIHHITTTLCGFTVMMKENSNIDVLLLIVLYAIFSSMAFCVNFYLALRIYSNRINLKKILSITSFWIYLISCIVSWIFQICISYIVLPTVPLWHSLLYFLFLYSVCKDDVILMKWLYNDNQMFKKLIFKY